MKKRKLKFLLAPVFIALAWALLPESSNGQGEGRKGKTVLSSLYDFDKDFSGYSLSFGPKYYGRDDLFEYINGGAEVYLKAGFLEVMGFELEEKAKEKTRYSIDIYDMGGPNNAVKMYENEKSGERCDIGNDLSGDMAGNQIRFHLGAYYVKVTSYSDVEAKKLINLAKILVSKIKGLKAAP